jgi:hypothetical protein
LNYQRDMQHNSLVWDEVESQISKVDNDILAIFDCCEAGSLCNVRKPTRYEYLGACGDTQRARGPGEKSFTTALTWALGELVSEQFNTVDLLTKIKAAPSFQHGQLPRLAPRGEWRSSITLAPLPPDDQRARDNEQVRPTPPFHVDLRFQFGCLDYDTFTKLAKEMKEIKRVIDAQRISFLGQHSIYERIREHVVHWVSVTKSERRRNKMEQQQEHREMELAKMYGMKWLNVHRNRKQAQVDHLDEDIDKVDLSVDANNMDGQASNQDSTSHHTQPEPKRPGKRRRQAEPLQHAKRRRQAKRVPVTPTPTDDSLGGTDSERK